MKAILTAALLLGLTAGSAAAQGSYPDQTIRILVGFTPGARAGHNRRLFAEKFTEAGARPSSSRT